MDGLSYLSELAIVLAAAVAFAAGTIRLGLGPIVGFLLAGAVVGPPVLGLVTSSEVTSVLGELGVVFLLFTIGLELPLRRIKAIGAMILMLGTLQVVVTAALLAWVATQLGVPAAGALAVGAGLALSSTTVVLRLLTDRGQLTSRCGRSVFAVLMIQDLLVGPLLVAILALGDGTADLPVALGVALVKAIAAVLLIFALGRRLLAPIYKPIAASDAPELFTGLSVLVVLAIGFATHAAGLSLAFGGFLAGVLLADTQYRHQIAADIRPFRGLLLGLFFVSVGMQLDLATLLEAPLAIAGGIIGLLLLKAAIIAPLAVLSGLDRINALRAGLMLAQGGEFAFVLWGAAADIGALDGHLARLLMAAVALSMALTPFVFMLLDRFLVPPGTMQAPLDNPRDSADELEDHVVVIGCGVVGRQVVERLIEAEVPVVALDRDPDKVRLLRRTTDHAFFGDATQADVLEMVGIERASAVIIALDDPRQDLLVVGVLHYLFLDMPILCRAHDEEHAERLIEAGATQVVPEVIDTGRHLVDALIVGHAPHFGTIMAGERGAGAES